MGRLTLHVRQIGSGVTNQILDSKYRQYYFALKRLYELHKEFRFGKTPDIPSGFSESLCWFILGAKVAKSRQHDAISSDGKRVEIKATGTAEGRTTISNSSDFDFLVWLHIDFDKDSVFIYNLPKALFSLSGKPGRKSIYLKSIAKNIQPSIYQFLSQ